jgi:stage III sporulation protein AH
MKFQKKYVVLAALVLALGTAIYVNWQFTSPSPNLTAKELGEASFVNATATSTVDEAVQTSALSKEQKNYFSTERLKRQTTQDGIIDTAQKILDSDKSDEEKSEAEKSIEKIIKVFTIQDSIEGIIKAKGFSECLCYISDEGVTVIVPDSELNDSSALVIDDAVTSHYEVDFEDISIVGA